MNTDIVVVSPARNPLIDAAKQGLLDELTSDLSRAMYGPSIEKFLSFIESSDSSKWAGSIAAAFAAHLADFKERGYAPSSIRAKRSHLIRFFEWGARVGWISQQTYAELKQIKAPKILGKKAGNWLTPEQMQMLLNAPDTSTIIGRRDKALLAVFLGCGLRRSEVVALTWGHLARYGDKWVIKNLKRKHGRMQDYILVKDWVIKAILQYKFRGKDDEHIFTSNSNRGDYGSITTDSLWRIVRKYTEQLGVGNITPHDLRRSFARASKANGMDMSQLQLMMGHSDPSITSKYVNELFNLEHIDKTGVELEV